MEIDELPVIAGLGKTQLIELTSLVRKRTFLHYENHV